MKNNFKPLNPHFDAQKRHCFRIVCGRQMKLKLWQVFSSKVGTTYLNSAFPQMSPQEKHLQMWVKHNPKALKHRFDAQRVFIAEFHVRVKWR